ncbi:hypothetical protein llap_4979 [Limosa lapponica baueri]|uniref:Uncharacterized protein n=1 Tax=Limosa lapponica baueri TaxID=1758121 RepID=A0A2I0UF81_LIMLA|nr:hypothetical protein llap_4979 [Limosa lapponica baueri]
MEDHTRADIHTTACGGPHDTSSGHTMESSCRSKLLTGAAAYGEEVMEEELYIKGLEDAHGQIYATQLPLSKFTPFTLVKATIVLLELTNQADAQ